jgi:hypothetical protein
LNTHKKRTTVSGVHAEEAGKSLPCFCWCGRALRKVVHLSALNALFSSFLDIVVVVFVVLIINGKRLCSFGHVKFKHLQEDLVSFII